ncbi:TPA: hypothetical protein EYP66_14305 [Candidatus Poribacteria bacterium]|nr:hypothetical protein [Candidatus Poribacteria bacterium]
MLDALTGQSFTGRASALTEGERVKTIRTAKYRYVSYADGRELLFDLETDTHGYHNVANRMDYAQALAEARHLIKIERPIPRSWAY